MSKFKVGDLVVPLPESDKHYSTTNCRMELAQVTEVFEDGDKIIIKVLRHQLGHTGIFPVDQRFFCKVNDECDSQTHISSLFRNA